MPGGFFVQEWPRHGEGMTDILLSAAGMAGAASIAGVFFLWLFRGRHWRHGDDPTTYSRILAAFTTATFTAMPLVLWLAASESEGYQWSLGESALATVATFIVLRMYTASARRDLQARLAKQRRRKW